MNFRKILFWTHFAAGMVAGIVIAIMSLTGVILAFEKQIIALAEGGARGITPPEPGMPRMAVRELMEAVSRAQPGLRPSAVTVFADESAAVLIAQGRTNAIYVNPWTGEVLPVTATGLRWFMQKMMEWHRWLALPSDQRPLAKHITGACNLAFCFLAISGLYLWWPKNWTGPALRAVTLFKRGLRGRARDWNWHNVIGLWSAPILIVLTLTAAPISYRWAGDLIMKLSGTPITAGAQGGTGGGGGRRGDGQATSPGDRRSSPGESARPAWTPPVDAIVEAVKAASPGWDQITVRLGGTEGQPVTASVRERRPWPKFATAQVTVDPKSAEVLRIEPYESLPLGRRIRSWTRFLHTGEALGLMGQAVAGLASLGGVILVWTGFSLAVRRVAGTVRRQQSPPPDSDSSTSSARPAEK